MSKFDKHLHTVSERQQKESLKSRFSSVRSFLLPGIVVLSLFFNSAYAADEGSKSLVTSASAGAAYFGGSVSPAMLEVATPLFLLAAIAVGIKWVKATFFA